MTRVYDWRRAPRADYAVIGDPVSHSQSPAMHRAAYRALGIRRRYVAIRVKAGEVSLALDTLRSQGYAGVNVTIPHKAETVQWLLHRDALIGRIGACNTVRLADRSGANTDGPGFLDTLARLGLPKSSRVLILGAGGTARAVVASLAEAGFELSIFNRTVENARALLREVQAKATILDAPILAGFDLIVNSTSASLQGQELPLDWSAAKTGAVAYDLMYQAEPTAFMVAAGAAGLRTLDGKRMLAAQGERALKFWLGRGEGSGAWSDEVGQAMLGALR